MAASSRSPTMAAVEASASPRRASALASLLPLALVVWTLIITPAHGYYLPGMYPRLHSPKSDFYAKVNSLTSVATGIPFNYYSLPFCKPADGIQKTSENLGELLEGDLIENSAYKFKTNVTEDSLHLCTTDPLTKDQVAEFVQKIDDFYRVNLILDNLPVTMNDIEKSKGIIITGIPVGFSKDKKYYIYNHITFKILIHKQAETSSAIYAISMGDSATDVIPQETHSNGTGFIVVGFEAAPCSVSRPSAPDTPQYSSLSAVNCHDAVPQVLEEGQKIVFTYDVFWGSSPILWASRWDAYLKMNGNQVHWFSILNSLMVVTFLAGMVMVILLRSVHRDLTRLDQLDKEEAAQMAEESGWKLVVGDVFRAPPFPGFLCIFIGNGVQVVCMAAITIFSSALGFMSPASRGALLTGVIFLYMLLGFVAGYVSSRLRVALTGSPEGKVSLAIKVASFFPGVTSIILLVLNSLLWSSGSTGAVPFSVFFELFFLWLMVQVPLTILGSHYGFAAERIQFPVRTNQIPRQIPPQKYPVWVFIFAGGILPFGTLYIELFFIMSSIWMDRFYYGFGFLFIVFLLLVIVCSEVAVVLTYIQLTMEDYHWWWRSIFASGSVALYMFLYSINYLIVDLRKMSSTLSEVLFLGYSFLMAFSVFLATGSVGFLASAYFVYYIFASVKLD